MCSFAHRFARGRWTCASPTTKPQRRDRGAGRRLQRHGRLLAQAEQKRSEFIANVSHELKTPMTTIAGFADGILDGTIPPEKERESLQVISSETRRLSRLVRRMLDLSGSSPRSGWPPRSSLTPPKSSSGCWSAWRPRSPRKTWRWRATSPTAPVMVWGDPDAVTQVCYNLLDNAVKFASPKGLLTLKITTKAGKAYIAIGNQGRPSPRTAHPHFRPVPQG